MNPWTACVSKKKYPSEAHAQSSGAMAELLSNRPLRVYKCPRCKLWHLTKRDASGILNPGESK